MSNANSGQDAQEVVSRVYDTLASFQSQLLTNDTASVQVGDGAAERAQELKSAAATKPDPGFVSMYALATGFQDLDDLGGLIIGGVTILAGRPSMGKSALGRSIADNVSRAGLGVHTFSLEDPRGPFFSRQVSDMTGINLQKVMTGNGLSEIDHLRIAEASDALKQRRWLLDDSAGISSAGIWGKVKGRSRANGTRLVVVDYAQLIREAGVKDKRAEVEKAAEGLVELARNERVAVLLLSQLSRQCEMRDDKKPVLSDLRETGVLEQIASSVWFVYRPAVYAKNESDKELRKTEGWVLVRKNKHGSLGEVELHWDGPTATYRPSAFVPFSKQFIPAAKAVSEEF